MSKRPGPNKDNFEKSRRAFLDAGRAEFTQHGYAQASTNRIVSATAMARGTLYYHFADKDALFRAVYQDVLNNLFAETRAAYLTAKNPWDAFITACLAYLRCCLKDDVRQIILLDGPSVLRPHDIQEMEASTTLGAIKEGVQALIARGYIQNYDTQSLTILISGALNEAARTIGLSKRSGVLLDNVEATFKSFMQALRTTHTHQQNTHGQKVA